MLVEDKFFSKIPNSQKIRCVICGNYCTMGKNDLGLCKQHKNINNKLFDCSHGKISSLNCDPIEKKPLYHFLPGSLTYSVGGFGCNMGCLHCQNYIISQNLPGSNNTIKISPETIVENAIKTGCKSISWTYNEPTIHLPFNQKTSLIGKEKNLKIVYVSNGYMSKESLPEIISFVDAFNIDLKSMSSNFYNKVCKANFNVVLENLKKIYSSGKHLEITNLILEGYNDSIDEIKSLVNFIITDLGPDIPLHFSKAFPYYKLDNISPTNENILFDAKNLAEDLGMEYVYIGNTPYNQNSNCPNCGEQLFKRNNYSIKNMNNINNSYCKKCGCKLNFYL